MLKKVLIANRGEIALRAIRACRQLGISTVAAYSQPDADLMHLRFADEAVCIGPASPHESYLNGPALISALDLTGADALYPGYGFLAENAAFAQQVTNSGFKFIGPSAECVELMGDKIASRKKVSSLDIPTVPGTKSTLSSSVWRATSVAEKIGYPVILKAAAGGGGRGMRVVARPSELPTALEITRREAKAAFGDDRLYMEHFLTNPQHIEVQVIGDGRGGCVITGDRDCSTQRRHQKLIEEGPAHTLTPEIRDAMYKCSQQLVEDLAYEGVGTLEYLVQRDEFYFLEMNTRIQVEHPVTEMVSGIDHVEQQMLIAGSSPSDEYQLPTPLVRGHAIECRINAEDPRTFFPSPGRVDIWHPPGGPGVRVDSHLYSGYEIPPYYDSLIAKVIVFGDTRGQAIRRARQALSELAVNPIKTNVELLQAVLRDPAFVSGDWSIGSLERNLSHYKLGG